MTCNGNSLSESFMTYMKHVTEMPTDASTVWGALRRLYSSFT